MCDETTGREESPNEEPTLRLFTSYYSAGNLINKSGLVPVRTSVGGPQFPLKYALSEVCLMLAPERAWLQMSYEDYRRNYRHKLHKLTVKRIREALLEISRRHDKAGLVLLCFENLNKPGNWCHRRLFAEWWEQQTGEKVIELDGSENRVPVVTKPNETQGTMF